MSAPEPTFRKPLGILALLVYISVYVAIVVILAEPVLALPALLQLPIWFGLGIAWVFPLKPAIRWIEGGRRK